MANLVRIRDVFLYVGFDENVAECWEAAKLLKQNNIPYTLLMYTDEASLLSALEPLKTWNLSADGEVSARRDDINFPFVHWRNIFDNDVNSINGSVGLTELQNSQLIANQEKVVRPS